MGLWKYVDPEGPKIETPAVEAENMELALNCIWAVVSETEQKYYQPFIKGINDPRVVWEQIWEVNEVRRDAFTLDRMVRTPGSWGV
ncbi:MAG: hypothetical protein M1839_002186 [Geoglossum umbratile]|nr:MAG: hypothetical protein M1839_002186 [Geoglossum umbratile]